MAQKTSKIDYVTGRGVGESLDITRPSFIRFWQTRALTNDLLIEMNLLAKRTKLYLINGLGFGILVRSITNWAPNHLQDVGICHTYHPEL